MSHCLSQTSRANIVTYINEFFGNLEIWEDIHAGKQHKGRIYQMILSFLGDPNHENATTVYVAFFDAYWIGIQSSRNPFVELVKKIAAFEEKAGTLLARQRDHYVHSVFVFVFGLVIFVRNKNFRSIFEKIALDIKVYPDAYTTKNEEFFMKNSRFVFTPAPAVSCPRSAKTGFRWRDRFSSSLIFI